MIFETDGFKTGDVYLPGLDITTRLDSNRYFRNDGIIDIDTRTDNLGGHLGITSGDKKASLIFVKKSNPITQLFYQGHESTHTLIFLGYVQILEEILRSEGFNLNLFQKYNSEESIANIGGIVAVYKAKKLGKIKEPPFTPPSFIPLINDLMISRESRPTMIREATKEDLSERLSKHDPVDHLIKHGSDTIIRRGDYMKVLVAYISETGNTKKVAEAIFDGIKCKKEIKKLDEINDIEGYDLAFLGFPIHRFGPNKKARDFLEKYCVGKNVALFITHAAPEYFKLLPEWLEKFEKAATGANLVSIFNCQGELAEKVESPMLKSPNPTWRYWAKMHNSKGQPDSTRLEKAKVFARETMNSRV